jgi:hypothetical protein
MFTRGARSVWAVLVWLVLFILPVQFYLAGFGAFGFHDTTKTAREDAWGPHAIVGTLIGLLVLLILVSALSGRLPRPTLMLVGGLFVAMLVQMILPGFGDSSSTRFIAALHPANALLITGLTMALAIRARRYLPIKRFRTDDDAPAEVSLGGARV